MSRRCDQCGRNVGPNLPNHPKKEQILTEAQMRNHLLWYCSESDDWEVDGNE